MELLIYSWTINSFIYRTETTTTSTTFIVIKDYTKIQIWYIRLSLCSNSIPGVYCKTFHDVKERVVSRGESSVVSKDL